MVLPHANRRLHVGGKSALALQGVRHNLGVRDTLVLWGEARFALPTWFTERFPARYVNARLFDWSDPDLAEATLHTPPGQTQGLRVAVPERATLELLDGITAGIVTAKSRRSEDFLALRIGLGYCWSVAVAALPGPAAR